MALKIDVIKWRCGDYFTPHFHSKDKHMTPIEFKKISKEHFYNEFHRSFQDHFRRLIRLYYLVRDDLDDTEKQKFFSVLDEVTTVAKTVDLITLPYRPIGEKNE